MYTHTHLTPVLGLLLHDRRRGLLRGGPRIILSYIYIYVYTHIYIYIYIYIYIRV